MERKVNEWNDSRIDEAEIEEMMLCIHDCVTNNDISRYENFLRKYKLRYKAGAHNVPLGDLNRGLELRLDYINYIRDEDVCDKE